MKGSTTHTVEWADATWYFISIHNMQLFISNPSMYAPQFGGHCAVAAHAGSTARADPEQWLIREDKLYLLFNEDPKHDFALYTDRDIGVAERNWAKGKNDL